MTDDVTDPYVVRGLHELRKTLREAGKIPAKRKASGEPYEVDEEAEAKRRRAERWARSQCPRGWAILRSRIMQGLNKEDEEKQENDDVVDARGN